MNILYIGFKGEHALCTKLCCELCSGSCVVVIVYDHVGTGLEKGFGNGAAYAAAATGNEYGLSHMWLLIFCVF